MKYKVLNFPDQSDWKQSAIWNNIPEASGFSREGCNDYFLLFRSSCRISRNRENMFLNFCAQDMNIAQATISEHYSKWIFDDAVEFYLSGNDGVLHQFLLNAKGGMIYFRNFAATESLPHGIEVEGKINSDNWQVIFKLPLKSISLNPDIDKIFCKIRRNAPREWIVPASELGGNPDGTPGMELIFTDYSVSAAECKTLEKILNADYNSFLTNFTSDTFFQMKLKLLNPAENKPIQKLLDEVKKNPPLNEKEQTELLNKFSILINSALSGTDDGLLKVDFEHSAGEIRRLNGINLAPSISNQSLFDYNELFKALKIPYSRLHDAPIANPGMQLVDTALIFRNFSADVQNPENYYFTQTDDYIANCYSLGTEVIYRLGASIEHSKRKYFAVAPDDYDKFAEICAGIVRHYNLGWANGFKYDIIYWEIWNEPDLGPAMWNCSMEEYFKLYKIVSTRLKKEFPSIKIGGPALSCPNSFLMRRFLNYCRTENAPLDFISYHRYGADIKTFINDVYFIALLRNEYGFNEAEIHINEWHYFPCTWDELRKNPDKKAQIMTAPDGLCGIDSAVFNVALLCRWQETPLSMSNYYALHFSWGLYDNYDRPLPIYDSFLAFAPFADYHEKVFAGSGIPEISILAGKDKKGNGLILIADFKGQKTELKLQLEGIAENATFQVQRLDQFQPLTPVSAKRTGNLIVLEKPATSAVFQIKIENLQLLPIP